MRRGVCQRGWGPPEVRRSSKAAKGVLRACWEMFDQAIKDKMVRKEERGGCEGAREDEGFSMA